MSAVCLMKWMRKSIWPLSPLRVASLRCAIMWARWWIWLRGTSDPEYPEYNECGCYWTGSFSDEDCHWDALYLQFDEFDHYSSYANPYEGLTIRPVTDKKSVKCKRNR